MYSVALSIRAKLRSRPIKAVVASIGGEIVPPVKATRNGCATLPSFNPYPGALNPLRPSIS